jgi:hypothetical protein
MRIDETTQWPHSRARKTVDMVRLTITHCPDQTTSVIVIEHDELNRWIVSSRKRGFSLEAESLGPSEVGSA